jgi:site-specific recombinase XerD
MDKTPPDLQARLRRFDPGIHVPHVLAYGHRLSELGYQPDSIRSHIAGARHFCAWLNRVGIDLGHTNDGTVRQFAEHDCHCCDNGPGGPLSRRYAFRVGRFAQFLADTGVTGASWPPKPSDDGLVIDYLDWLRRHRGLSGLTVHSHRKVLRQLLPVIGADPSRYAAALIRSAILARKWLECPRSLKRTAYVLRSWLRYLGTVGHCPTTLVHAVPTIANWRGSYLPRYLLAADVERVITACDTQRPAGRRDRAILLLLARLGLRAEDVRSLQLTDIDWGRGQVRLCGKSRRETRLPLPQEVGDAVLAYLEDGRPPVPEPHLFLRSAAPWTPFTESAAISKIVGRALDRAGIVEAPSRGAHLLRHSAATTMLRSGATLETIGTVLRHRNITTTAHYAKVDVDRLRLIAQPWPGDRSC